MVKGVTLAYATGARTAPADSHEAAVAVASDADDDHCSDHLGDMDVKRDGKSGKHAGHACPGCAVCALCLVIPYASALLVHLDTAPAQAPSGLPGAFASHIPDALQRPPAPVV